MNLILIGLPGCGKTTLARETAQHLGMRFLDTDEQIAKEAEQSIPEIFAQQGESHFRAMETAMLARLNELENSVISTGGGVVVREENLELLRRAGTVIFIDRSPERIVQNVQCNTRPLLADGAERVFKLDKQRRPKYRQAADFIFCNDKDLDQATADFLRLLQGLRADRHFAVIGDPISHSLSPLIHNTVFPILGVDGDYRAIQVEKGGLPTWMQRVRRSRCEGFNLTAPHKQDIIPLLDEVETDAKFCGAVNTVHCKNGRWLGFNTDMDGLRLSIEDTGHLYRNSHMVILGTGGAAAGLAYKAALEKAASITILGRRPQAGQELLERIKSRCSAQTQVGNLSPASLKQALNGCDILINTIPSHNDWMDSEKKAAILTALPKTALVVDIAYSPPRPPLLAAAEAEGYTVLNGLGMLIYQAILADEIFLDRKLNKQAIYQVIVQAIAINQRKDR